MLYRQHIDSESIEALSITRAVCQSKKTSVKLKLDADGAALLFTYAPHYISLDLSQLSRANGDA